MQGVIDLLDSKIAGEVLDADGNVIRVIEPSPDTVKNLTEFRKMFFKEDGSLVTDLMELDARRTSEMKKLAFKLQGEGTGDAGQIYQVMDNMTALMDEAHPDYALATETTDFGDSFSIVLNGILSGVQRLNLIPLRDGKYPTTQKLDGGTANLLG